jgi:hypothetical protein
VVVVVVVVVDEVVEDDVVVVVVVVVVEDDVVVEDVLEEVVNPKISINPIPQFAEFDQEAVCVFVPVAIKISVLTSISTSASLFT